MRPEDRIGQLAVCQQGYVFEVTNIKHNFHHEASVGKKTRPVYAGIDIFSGLTRQSESPIFLSPGVVQYLKEVLAKV